VSLLFHVRFLAFQVETSHSFRTSFRGLDQRIRAESIDERPR
jgi:hypothetical protein